MTLLKIIGTTFFLMVAFVALLVDNFIFTRGWTDEEGRKLSLLAKYNGWAAVSFAVLVLVF